MTTPPAAPPQSRPTPSEDPLATTLFRSPLTNVDADARASPPAHKASISDAPQYDVVLEELPWPAWPAVRLRTITHFNRLVKPRDRTRALIAEHLEGLPYAQPARAVRAPTQPPSPAQIAEKRVAALRRTIEARWPAAAPVAEEVDHLGNAVKKAEAESSVVEYRAAPEPARPPERAEPAPDALALALEEPQATDEEELVGAVVEALEAEAGEGDPELAAFLVHLAREADDGAAFRAAIEAQGAEFRDQFVMELYALVEKADAPRPAKMALLEERVMVSGDAQATLAAAGARERFDAENEDPTIALEAFHRAKPPAIPDAVVDEFQRFIDRDPARRLEVDEVRHEGRLTAEALHEARLMAATLDADELQVVGDERELDPIFISSEMAARLEHTISTNLGNDLHRDRVNSVLALPLSSESVYCHADLQQGLPGAVVAYDGGDGSTNTLATHHLKDADVRRKAQWEQAVGEWHAQQGNSVDAYEHFGRAAKLYERGRFADEGPLAVNAQDVFVYDQFAIKALCRIQRHYRRHHVRIHKAVTRAKALYRGSVVRNRARRAARRIYAAALFAQKPCRRWYVWRWNSAIHLQRCERGRRGRRVAWLILRERELRWKLAFFLQRCIAKARARVRRGRIWGATSIERVWRGIWGRIAFAEALARFRLKRLRAATLAQTVARRGRARARAKIRARALRRAEALRLAEEGVLVKRAAALAELRTALKLETPSARGPALRFWSVAVQADDARVGVEKEVQLARAAFAAGTADENVLRAGGLPDALAAAGLSTRESDVAAAFAELGGREDITFTEFEAWLRQGGLRRRPRVGLLARLFAKKPRVDAAAALLRRADGEARKDAARRAARRAVHGVRRELGHPRFACGACHATFALQRDFTQHFGQGGACPQTTKRAAPFHLASIVVNQQEHRARTNCLKELARLEDEDRCVTEAGRDAYNEARHALDADAKELTHVAKGLRARFKKRMKVEAELRDVASALDCKGLLDARCVRGLFRALQAGDVEPGSQAWRNADVVSNTAAEAVLALKALGALEAARKGVPEALEAALEAVRRETGAALALAKCDAADAADHGATAREVAELRAVVEAAKTNGAAAVAAARAAVQEEAAAHEAELAGLKEALEGRPGDDVLVDASDLIAWWRTGGRATGLSTSALKDAATVRALAKDVLGRRAAYAARAAARRAFRKERPPLRDVGFDAAQLKAYNLQHLSSGAVDGRERLDADAEARCAAAIAALVKKGQEKRKRTSRVAPARLALDDLSSDEDDEAGPPVAVPATQVVKAAVSQREAERLLDLKERRLEEACRETLSTQHGKDMLAFEAARLGAAAWLEDGGTQDQRSAAAAARCFDVGCDGVVDERDLPELLKYATGDLSKADHAWMYDRKNGTTSTDEVVAYLTRRKRLLGNRDFDATLALVTRARHGARACATGDVNESLRRARRNALDHLVTDACLRARTCRDAEHRVRILSATRRGLARLQWDACTNEAMRESHVAQAATLSTEDAALREAAYVFAWFDVVHSGVLDAHEACPKFLLAFGAAATWPEALVATRDAAPGKSDVSWPALKTYLVAHRPDRLKRGWCDVRPGSELDRAVLAARVEASLKLRQALAAERRAERGVAKLRDYNLSAFAEARHAKTYSFVGDLVRAAHAESFGRGDATEAARRKLERAAYHAEADARRFLATAAGQRCLLKRERAIVARRQATKNVAVDGLPMAAAIALDDVWRDHARAKDNTVDRAEMSRIVYRLVTEHGFQIEGDVAAALAPPRVVADPELLTHRAAIKDATVRRLLAPPDKQGNDKAVKQELGRLAKRKLSLLMSLAVHHGHVKDRGGRAPDAARVSRAEFDAWIVGALARTVVVKPPTAPREAATQSVLAAARSDARDTARDLIAREHLGVKAHVSKPSHTQILHRCAVLSAFATADVEHFLKSAAGRGVLRRRADALAILAPPWLELIEDAVEDDNLRYLRHMAWRLFSANVVGDAKGIDRHEAPHVRLPAASAFRRCGLKRVGAVEAFAEIGDTFAHEAGLMSFDEYWKVITTASSTTAVDKPSIREYFAKKPSLKQLARTHVEAEARQRAREIVRLARDHREHHAPPEFANVYVK